MSRAKLVIVAAMVVAAAGVAVAQTVETNKPVRKAMRLKLDYSQGVLEGITLEKFDLVATNAALLRNMNLTNTFLELGNPDYFQNITNFQLSVDALLRAAKSENLEGATEAYARVSRDCVACHQQFRRDQLIRLQKRSSPTVKP